MDYHEFRRIEKDLELIEYGIDRSKEEGYDGIHFKCWDREEAMWVKNICKEKCPEMLVKVSWRVFKGVEGRAEKGKLWTSHYPVEIPEECSPVG